MSSRSTARALAAGALLAVSLAACGGAGRSTDSPPFFHCEAVPPFIIDPQATLAAPAKGATGVPVNVGGVSFTVGDPALRQGETLRLGSASTDFTTTQITTANGVMSAAVPALTPHTLYTVTVTAPLPPERQTECKTQILGELGTFTTQ